MMIDLGYGLVAVALEELVVVAVELLLEHHAAVENRKRALE